MLFSIYQGQIILATVTTLNYSKAFEMIAWKNPYFEPGTLKDFVDLAQASIFNFIIHMREDECA